MRGPALVTLNKHGICIVVVTNTAPSIHLVQNEIVGTLDQWTDVGTPRELDQQTVDKFIHKLETKTQKLIQNKTRSGLLLFLRATSLAPVHALTPTNLEILKLQAKDPDLDLIRTWPLHIQPDHQSRLELQEKNIMIDKDKVVWVQCQPECPKAPPRMALYLPLKYRSPVICQFWQRHPDLTIVQQISKLHERTSSKALFQLCRLCPTPGQQGL